MVTLTRPGLPIRARVCLWTYRPPMLGASVGDFTSSRRSVCLPGLVTSAITTTGSTVVLLSIDRAGCPDVSCCARLAGLKAPIGCASVAPELLQRLHLSAIPAALE